MFRVRSRKSSFTFPLTGLSPSDLGYLSDLLHVNTRARNFSDFDVVFLGATSHEIQVLSMALSSSLKKVLFEEA